MDTRVLYRGKLGDISIYGQEQLDHPPPRRRKDNGASGKRCDMDEKPEGSIRGNELINDVRWQRREATWTTNWSLKGIPSSRRVFVSCLLISFLMSYDVDINAIGAAGLSDFSDVGTLRVI